MTAAGNRVRPRPNLVIESEKDMELDVRCLEGMGISLLSEWDVLVFVYRHGASLTSADQIARLVGYESTVVDGALKRLEREKLMERSRSAFLPNPSFDGCWASALPPATREPIGKSCRAAAAGKTTEARPVGSGARRTIGEI
jgi:hypothetical protein